ncbi:MAG: FkbM family methyltransferase [Candidatus Omnitrophica bacterium]|nr:FkbM family methyltransferase [Candidatus Omnitrophota bacterium]
MIPNAIIQLMPESNLKRRFEDINHVESLPIAECGESDNGSPFIVLENGVIFYGDRPFRLQKYIYRFFTSRSFRKKVPESAFGIAWNIWIRYWKGGHITQEKEYQLKPGDTVVEAGAFIGYYTLKMSERVGPNGHVVAIEPIEENRKIILKNIEANNIHNVTVLPYAIWNEKTETTFYVTSRQKNSLVAQLAYSRGKARALTVPANTIDNIIRETNIKPPDLVIITVNGTEVEALEGMEAALEYDNLHLVVAAKYVVDGVPVIERVKALLEKKNYKLVLDHYGFVTNENPKQQAVVYASRK